jgi:uncharacterized protein YceH (UPF0502 family)
MSLSTPHEVMARLEELDGDLATRQNEIEEAADKWAREKREREKTYAHAYMEAQGTVDQRKAQAVQASYLVGLDAEARYEALKAVLRVIETRVGIGQSILRAQGRA